jgi:P-type conjugative transfer protein TrbL
LLEILAELTRYILFTGFFWWVLQNGAGFANAIINSLVQIGGNAAGNGGFMVPGDVITLSLQVFNQTLQHVNFLQPESILIPVLIALIILILCALIAVNMILLLCAAWVVVYAGLIFLGFGGCRWTSDWAIGYWRTIVGIGVSLLTMELIIGIGIQFLKDLITQTAQTLSAGPLAIIMVACIILVVIAHQLPRMVAGMVVGGGHNGAVGGMGVMALIGSAIAAASLAGRVSNAATGPVSNSQRLLSDRIQAAEATMSAGSGLNGSSGSNGASESSAVPRPSGGYSAPVAASSAPPGASSSVYNVSTSGNSKKPATSPASTSKVTDEPPLSRPLSPDEQWELENPEFL